MKYTYFDACKNHCLWLAVIFTGSQKKNVFVTRRRRCKAFQQLRKSIFVERLLSCLIFYFII